MKLSKSGIRVANLLAEAVNPAQDEDFNFDDDSVFSITTILNRMIDTSDNSELIKQSLKERVEIIRSKLNGR